MSIYVKLMSVVIFYVLSAAGVLASCDPEQRSVGLNIVEVDCQRWTDKKAPPIEQFYVSLEFDFKLAAMPDVWSRNRFWDAVKQAVFTNGGNATKIMISVKPEVGNYQIEQPLYVFGKQGNESDADINLQFSTPFIRYDQRPVAFKLNFRASKATDYNISGLLAKLKPILEFAAPQSALVSGVTDAGIVVATDVVDKVLESYSNAGLRSTTRFEMAGASANGATKRVLKIRSLDSEPIDIGTLTVTAKFRRSMIDSDLLEPNASFKDVFANFSNDVDLLTFELPTIGAATQTVLGGLGGKADDQALVSAAIYEDKPAMSMEDICAKLDIVAKSKFGFNDVDSIRMTYELLRMGNKDAALISGSNVCFSNEDWKKIAANSIFVAEGATPSRAEIDLFATGMRQGLREKNYSSILSSSVELDDRTKDRVLGEDCQISQAGQGMEKVDAMACLDKIEFNRYDIKIEEQKPVSILAARRSVVLKEIAKIKNQREDLKGVEPKAVVADSNTATLAASKVLDFIKLSLFFDSARQIQRVIIEDRTQADIGTEAARDLAFSCWASKSSRQTAVCATGVQFSEKMAKVFLDVPSL